jgi:hypothetical protein
LPNYPVFKIDENGQSTKELSDNSPWKLKVSDTGFSQNVPYLWNIEATTTID